MKTFTPFANEADVLQIGQLQIENRLDRITLSGDLDLTLDQVGLEHARTLHALLGEIVGKMAAQAIPQELASPAVKTVKNPFE